MVFDSQREKMDRKTNSISEEDALLVLSSRLLRHLQSK